MTTVMPVQQQNVDPEATTRFSLPLDGDVNTADGSTRPQSPAMQNGDYGNAGKDKSSKKHRTPLIVAGVAAFLTDVWRRRLGMVVLPGAWQLLDHASAGWHVVQRFRSLPHHWCEMERL